MLKLKLKPYIALKQIQKPLQSEFEKFATALEKLKSEIDNNKEASETNIEEYSDHFLRDSFGYSMHENKKIDKTIKIGTTVVVQFEFKAPKNTKEMIDANNINCKALHESVYYYMLQRNIDNDEIKRVVISDGNVWFVFDAIDFEKLFWLDKNFNKKFVGFLTEDKQKKLGTTYFYDNIAKPFIDKMVQKNSLLEEDVEIEALHFDIRRMKSEADKIAFFKVLSKPYLLKEQAKKDPNSLDDAFYKKLLDLMGLEQATDGGKKIIRRCVEARRKDGSLLENTIASIKRSKRNPPTNVESAALSLVIIWINRILFLKLLGSQLLRYHKNDDKYRFLDFGKLGEYDKLNSLFFEVLAKPKDIRNAKYKYFEDVPYLNSSLFELSVEEDELISISGLEDDTDYNGAHLLKAFFEFLDSYDFGAEDEETIRSESKTLISSAVLGLVFEKINGYKDGSFYTPSFITQYMAKETIQKAVLSKFKETKGYECDTLDDLRNHLGKKTTEILEANKIFDTITICDPAVGSGHFLVSCLNELIRTKAELGILADESGVRVNEYELGIQNDELVVWDASSGKEFAYTSPFGKDASRVQKTLFDEKRRIIENQLFGVDINQNSVNICRLRLWIELLKNAYYKESGELETLPNIDINIKCGNSLVSLFPIKSPLINMDSLKKVLTKYAEFVSEYKNTTDKSFKLKASEETKSIESAFIKYQFAHSKEAMELKDLVAKFIKKHHASYLPQDIRLFFGDKGSVSIFGDDEDTTVLKENKNAKSIEKDKNEILKKYELYRQMESRTGTWANALEWRYIFPEIVDEKGDFVGFDVVIGNPPYFNIDTFGAGSSMLGYLPQNYPDVYMDKSDILFYFIARAIEVSKGQVAYIISNAMLKADKARKLRNHIVDNAPIEKIINFEKYQVFDEANITSMMIFMNKKHTGNAKVQNFTETVYDKNLLLTQISQESEYIDVEFAKNENFALVNEATTKINQKIDGNHPKLGELLKVGKGMETAANEVFGFDKYPTQFEATYIKKRMSGEIIEKYSHKEPLEYLLYFENVEKFDDLPKNIRDYLSQDENKKKLEDRATVKNEGRAWWRYSRPMHKEFYHFPKIWCSYRAKENVFCLDESSGFIGLTNTTVIFGNNPNIDLKYVVALLNSKLLNFCYKSIGKQTGSGVYEYFENQISKFPIPEIDREAQKPFIELVDRILNLKKLGGDTKEIEAKIDTMAYELYGLGDDEMAIAESK